MTGCVRSQSPQVQRLLSRELHLRIEAIVDLLEFGDRLRQLALDLIDAELLQFHLIGDVIADGLFYGELFGEANQFALLVPKQNPVVRVGQLGVLLFQRDVAQAGFRIELGLDGLIVRLCAFLLGPQVDQRRCFALASFSLFSSCCGFLGLFVDFFFAASNSALHGTS